MITVGLGQIYRWIQSSFLRIKVQSWPTPYTSSPDLPYSLNSSFCHGMNYKNFPDKMLQKPLELKILQKQAGAIACWGTKYFGHSRRKGECWCLFLYGLGKGGTNWKWGREWNIKCLQKERMRGELSKLKKIYKREFFLLLIILLSSLLFVSIWCSILSPIFNLSPPLPKP